MVTVLLALFVLTIIFIIFWALFAPDDNETIYYRNLVGVKGGKAKKEIETDDGKTIIEDDF